MVSRVSKNLHRPCRKGLQGIVFVQSLGWRVSGLQMRYWDFHNILAI